MWMRKLTCGAEQQNLIGDRWKPFPGVEVEKAKGDIGDDVDENPDGKAEPSRRLQHDLLYLHLTSARRSCAAHFSAQEC